MTERFTVIREVYQVYKDKTLYEVSDGTHTFFIYENAQELTDLLNDLSEENEQLKKELEDAVLDVKIYKNANATFDNVYQENNKLKSRIEYLERKIERERNATNKQYEKWEKEALEKINKLEKENAFLTVEVEALKQIKPIRKLPRELTVLKLDDGDV